MSVKTIVLVALTIAPLAAASGKNNVASIITLLNGLKDTAIEEGQAEEAAYATFTHWCKTSISDLKDAISKEVATIDQLDSAAKGFSQTIVTLDGDAAKIAEYNADTTISARHRKDWVEEVDGERSDLASAISRLEAAGIAAGVKDGKRIAAFDIKNANLGDTLIAVKYALANMTTAQGNLSLLQARNNLGQVLALLSVEADDQQRQTLFDFVSSDAPATVAAVTTTVAPVATTVATPDVMAKGDKAAAVSTYTGKSGPVIELLKGLVHKFEDDVFACRAEETRAINAYALEKQSRDAALAAVRKSKQQKDTTEGTTQGSLSTANADIGTEEADETADKGTLKATSEQCENKAREWEERSTTRSREISAISMAIKILAKVSGVRTEAPNNPALGASPIAELQEQTPVSFLQIDDPKAKVVSLLHRTAQTTHSDALERLAMEISAKQGPFAVVNDAISKMIYKLMAEQTSEDKHKQWCDIELAKASKVLSDHDDKLIEININIGSNTARVSKLTNDITAANKMVSDITGYMTESTEIRNIGRKENKLALKDSEQAQTAIANSVAVLEEHYKSSGMVAKESYEFIQTGIINVAEHGTDASTAGITLPADPALWDSSYTGVSDPKTAGTGVLAILLEVASDFSRMEAETKAQEAQDQRDYDREMAAHKVEKARRQTESTSKQSEKKRQVAKGVSLAGQKKHATDELAAATKYEQDLQAPCVNGDSTYAEKKAARATEIAALKQSKETMRDAFKATVAPTVAATGAGGDGTFLEIRRHA